MMAIFNSRRYPSPSLVLSSWQGAEQPPRLQHLYLMGHPQARLRMPLLFIQVSGRSMAGTKQITSAVKYLSLKKTFHE